MDRVYSWVLEICQIGFDLILTNILSKDTVLKNEMKKMRLWVGGGHKSPEVKMVDENEEMAYHDNSYKDLDLDRP